VARLGEQLLELTLAPSHARRREVRQHESKHPKIAQNLNLVAGGREWLPSLVQSATVPLSPAHNRLPPRLPLACLRCGGRVTTIARCLCVPLG